MKSQKHKRKNKAHKTKKKSFLNKVETKYIFATIVCFIAIVLFTGGFLLYKIKSSEKELPETVGNTMRKIPSRIKKELSQTKTSSISSTLRVPILMYHYVEYVKDKRDKERMLLNVNPNIFEEQIKTLLNAGYTFITAKELGDIFDGKTKAPEKPVILTFDDGHWDLDTVVLPILKKYGVKATAYIVPGFVGTNSDSLTPQELRDVIDSGLVDVGAHTVHHVSLKGKALPIAQYEIDNSKKMLEQQYHIHVYSFAYPYGTFDEQTIALVQQAGFTTAVSTIPGNIQSQKNRFFLFRIRPGYMSGNALLNYINGTWRPYQRK